MHGWLAGVALYTAAAASGAPAIDSYAMPDDLVLRAREPAVVPARMTLAGLPPGATIRIRGLQAGDPAGSDEACVYLVHEDPIAWRADPQGRALVEVKGSVRASRAHAAPLVDGFTGPCRPWMRIAIESAAERREVAVTGRSFRAAPLTVYRYEDTWALRDLLRFQMRGESPGVCEGQSQPIGPGSVHAVGVQPSGGDLSIAVRSGPFGTACRAVAPPAPIPASARLRSIEWAVEKTGVLCDVGESRLPAFASREARQLASGAIPDRDPGRYCCSIAADPSALAQLRVQAPTRRPDQHFLHAMHVRLGCLPGPSNDEGVRVVLRSIAFDGPPNLRFVP